MNDIVFTVYFLYDKGVRESVVGAIFSYLDNRIALPTL